jgi:hypothetical protein
MFVRFQLRHGEQMKKNIELVTAGEPNEAWERLADEGRSLIWPPLLGRLIDPRAAIPFQRCALPPGHGFAQNLHPNSNNVQKLPLDRGATLRWYFTTF